MGTQGWIHGDLISKELANGGNMVIMNKDTPQETYLPLDVENFYQDEHIYAAHKSLVDRMVSLPLQPDSMSTQDVLAFRRIISELRLPESESDQGNFLDKELGTLSSKVSQKVAHGDVMSVIGSFVDKQTQHK